MAVTGPIADAVQGVLPEEWKALGSVENGSVYGDAFLQRHIDAVTRRFLGDTVDETAQEELHPLVLDYIGKRVALSLIVPGIDFWSKQAVSLGASGRNEQKTWAANRSADLRQLRIYLNEEIAELWIDVQALLPTLSTRRSVAVPTVLEEAVNSPDITANPRTMEPAFDRSREGEQTNVPR